MSQLARLNISSRSSLIKPLIAPLSFHNPIKSYSGHHNGEEKEDLIDMERAQSTLEVMQQLSNDKEENERTMDEKSHQGFVSQTFDKAADATQEAVGGDHHPNPDAIKEKFKRPGGGPSDTYHEPRGGRTSV